MRGFNRLVASSLVAAAVLLAAAPARASIPLSAFVTPSSVTYQPDKNNATKVFIEGVFMFLTMKGGGFAYTAPQCGYMYFACKPGEEAMCRMQWGEIEAQIGNQVTCIGFGPQSMLNTGILHKPREPLGNPDTWDNGMGTFVTQGFANCPAAHKLDCNAPQPPPDLGVVDPPPDLGQPPRPGDMARPSRDLASPPVDLSMAPPVRDLSLPPATMDFPGPPPPPPACTVGTRPGSAPLFGLGLLLAILGRIVRRRAR